MESLKLLKFWRKAENVVVADVISAIDYISNNRIATKTDDFYSDDDDDDDSFFELELNADGQSGKLFDSPRDVFYNGKTLSKPQSPISTLKSGPKFKLFVVGFTKSRTGNTGNNIEKGESKRFVYKSNGEETPVLSRDNSLRSKLLRERSDNSTKRPDSLRSKLLKPLYSMASKRYNADSPVVSPMVSPVSSPRRKTSGLKNVFGKSKSNVGTTPSPRRNDYRKDDYKRDDCLLHDGIQGAILHCNSSYNSTAEGTTSQQSVFQARDSELTKRCSI